MQIIYLDRQLSPRPIGILTKLAYKLSIFQILKNFEKLKRTMFCQLKLF